MEADVYLWCYALLVVYSRKEEDCELTKDGCVKNRQRILSKKLEVFVSKLIFLNDETGSRGTAKIKLLSDVNVFIKCVMNDITKNIFISKIAKNVYSFFGRSYVIDPHVHR